MPDNGPSVPHDVPEELVEGKGAKFWARLSAYWHEQARDQQRRRIAADRDADDARAQSEALAEALEKIARNPLAGGHGAWSAEQAEVALRAYRESKGTEGTGDVR